MNAEKDKAQIDWQQVALNGGPPCFFVEGPQYCGRAERWPGHGNEAFHKFVSLDALLATARKEAREVALKDAIAAVPQVVRDVAASTVAPQPSDDGWVTFGRVKVDIENETETFERILPDTTPAPSAATQDDRCKCGLDKDDPIHWFSTEWQPMHKFTPRPTALNLSSLARKAAEEIFTTVQFFNRLDDLAEMRDANRKYVESQITAIIERCLSEGES